MRLFKPMPMGLLGLVLIAGLSAGCSEAVDDGAGFSQTDQEMVALSIQQDAPGAQAMNLAYTPVEGWHLKFTDDLLPTNFGDADNVDIRHHPMDMDFDASGASRFDASLAGPAYFSASVPRAQGFGAGLAGPAHFSASTGVTAHYSNPVSYGGTCSLDGLCDFVALACNMSPGLEGCGSGAVAQCRSQINRAASQLPPEARPFVCAVGNFFSCAANAISSGGNAEARLEQCAAQSGGAGLLGIFFVAAILDSDF